MHSRTIPYRRIRRNRDSGSMYAKTILCLASIVGLQQELSMLRLAHAWRSSTFGTRTWGHLSVAKRNDRFVNEAIYRVSHRNRFGSCGKDQRRWIAFLQSSSGGDPSTVPQKVMQKLCSDILPTLLSSNNNSGSIAMEPSVRPMPAGDIHQSTTVSDDANTPPSSTTASTCKFLLVVGVSGGCDSVALLTALMELTQQKQHQQENIPPDPVLILDINLDSGERVRAECDFHIVHFDHQQRGSESDKDRELVEKLCHQWGLACSCFYWQDAAQSDKFSQEIARNWRRTQMRKVLSDNVQDETRVGVLLTAHHKDDSDETLLLKLLRGVHLTNLSGLEGIRRDEEGAFWARPLVEVPKSDLVEYLVQREIVWREDASNQSDKYLRNRVRNELVPLLEDLVGGRDSWQRRLGNIERQSLDLGRYLECQANEYLRRYCKDGVFMLASGSEATSIDPVIKQSLHTWLNQETGGHQFTYTHLERVCNQLLDYPKRRKWRLNIGYGWSIQREGDILHIVNDDDDDHDLEHTSNSLAEVSWSMTNADSEKYRNRVEISLPCRMVSSGLRLYIGQAGNGDELWMTPPWRRGRSPIRVTEFLRGQKVPLHLRKTSPVLVTHIDSGKELLLSVFVSTKDSWVQNADFGRDEGDEALCNILVHINEKDPSKLYKIY